MGKNRNIKVSFGVFATVSIATLVASGTESSPISEFERGSCRDSVVGGKLICVSKRISFVINNWLKSICQQ